jgi:hypothetical protein
MPNVIRRAPATDNLCCAPNCLGDAHQTAPVPLCSRHVRETYEYGVALVESRWASAVDAAHADLRAKESPDAYVEPPVVLPPPRPVPAPEPTFKQPQGYVYFVRFSDRIKIGWSGNPASRFRNIPHDEVLAVVPGSMQHEHQYHARFHYLRTGGEWFRAEPELVEFIASLPKVKW